MSWVGSTMMNSELVGSSVFVLVAKTRLLVKWICSSWKQTIELASSGLWRTRKSHMAIVIHLLNLQLSVYIRLLFL
jgi:hypothetical protein